MGSATVAITLPMLLLVCFDHPYGMARAGSNRPPWSGLSA